MNGIYLGIGGNEGDRAQNVRQAQSFISKSIGSIVQTSSVYQTAAWGNTEQPDFYNQVLLVETKLSANNCLKQCRGIEKKLGRVRSGQWSGRTMDIDILFFNQEIIRSKKLTVPHPYLHERNFVLVPLNEIAPHFIHPVFRKKIFTLLKNSPDKLPVKKVN